MKIDTYFGYSCDICGETSELYKKDYNWNVGIIKKQLIDNGWKFIKGNNVCNICYEKGLYKNS